MNSKVREQSFQQLFYLQNLIFSREFTSPIILFIFLFIIYFFCGGFEGLEEGGVIVLPFSSVKGLGLGVTFCLSLI